jgi:hypothetical protein
MISFFLKKGFLFNDFSLILSKIQQYFYQRYNNIFIKDTIFLSKILIVYQIFIKHIIYDL